MGHFLTNLFQDFFGKSGPKKRLITCLLFLEQNLRVPLRPRKPLLENMLDHALVSISHRVGEHSE